MSSHFIVLFTTQKIQKVKKWKDGIAIYYKDNKKFELYEEINGKKQLILTDTIKNLPNVGDIIEIDKYLIDFDSIQSEELNPQIKSIDTLKILPISSRICSGMKKRNSNIKPLLTITPTIIPTITPTITQRKTIIKKEKEKNSIKDLIKIFENKEINKREEIKQKQKQDKKINKERDCIKKEIGSKGFKVPKIMEKIEFPTSLNDKTSQGIYNDIGKYVTDMNNIVVNEINYKLAEIGKTFYTIVDTQINEMRNKERINIYSQENPIKQISHKEGINKRKGYYYSEQQSKGIEKDKKEIKEKEVKYKLSETFNHKINMKELKIKKFEEEGIIIFLDIEIFQSKKLTPTPEDPEALKTMYFMKINDLRKVKFVN
ncbi:hypothetical protein EDI_351450 [Entamoeba dispar SAW760]|uniref:5'-3' DNA helicase ZGRF1-like N-terminal domain-containing protein n=1 Tax=Entamoeba dispar (strain ATCC PRA-260 / SAW760) TaxID=370354 RepID=B0ERA7_ENTDS|nr:uncharacterized protein EDI_351450 [Entamoeba dispar SAW760]EDR22955.1 hypothetical protein EDI_351450 [Entamoeba dispar SAW760]|eukprot:EDR22955.1 hypothetical protein EDI_351450 [Entamoeba dispar SAW760]